MKIIIKRKRKSNELHIPTPQVLEGWRNGHHVIMQSFVTRIPLTPDKGGSRHITFFDKRPPWGVMVDAIVDGKAVTGRMTIDEEEFDALCEMGKDEKSNFYADLVIKTRKKNHD